MKSVGIDIGSSQIKVVEIQSGSKGISLSRYFVHDFSVRTNADPVIETIEFLRPLLQDYDPAQTRFCIALRQDQVVVRNKLFPFNDRTKILKTLPMELDEDIPFSIDDSVYDAKIIRLLGPQAEVLACAVPKVHLEKILAVFKDCGIEPDVVSAEGMALANIFERWNEPPQPEAPNLGLDLEGLNEPTERELQVVLNIGHSRTLVLAFEKNRLIGLRSLTWGGRNVADAISRKYEMPFAEALKEMELKGFILNSAQEGHFEAKIFSDTIAKAVRELLRDIQLTLLEFKSEYKGIITQIDVTGGFSHLQGLGPFMTQSLEVSVNKIQILERFSQVFFERTDITDSRLGVAIGLAIEGVKKPRNPALNFLKGAYAKQNTQLEAFISQWSLTLKVAIASFIIFTVWALIRENLTLHMVDAAQESLKGMAKTVANLQGPELSERGVKKYIAEKKKVVAELKSLAQIAPMNSALEILKKVNENVPGRSSLKLDIKRLNVDDSQVLLEGYLGSVREVDLLRQSLSHLSSDGKVLVQKSGFPQTAGRTPFSFFLTVDRGVLKK
ncbi:MAG: pilus assembly protein PilM [Bdellovibrionaceae bacterium]|nr:pilus assembly protein PilM [Pseudobdellovibrionaceae bacterium]